MFNTDAIRLTLPLPISVNTAYAGMKRRHKSDAYLNWVLRANIAFNQKYVQFDYNIEGNNWLKVYYKFYMPIFKDDGSKKKVDTFNFEKVLSDYLSRIPGFEDSNIKIGTVEKINSNRMEVDIVIEEYLEECQEDEPFVKVEKKKRVTK